MTMRAGKVRRSAYRVLEHTGEVAVRATGRDLAEAFANAAKALFAVNVDLRGVRRRKVFQIRVEADRVENLLVEWLNELIYVSEAQGVLMREFEVKGPDASGARHVVSSTCWGEPYDASRHRSRLHVKGATYSGTTVERRDGDCSVHVILDV